MALVGIVAEFNPFHNGHKYLIDCAKKDGHAVCAVISGNFVQRGDIAIIPKFERAKQALLNGADIVCELPTPWAMSTAQNFALGAISQLNAMGIESLYFGSESGDAEKLIKANEIIDSVEFSVMLKNNLTTGKTFASIRQEVLEKLSPNLSNLLSGANDSLAIEYISASKKINPSITFKAIKRVGAQHNDNIEKDVFSTATILREKILNNSLNGIENYIPKSALEVLIGSDISNVEHLELAILSKLRSMTIKDFSCLPDISEGLENRIFTSVKNATSLDDLYTDLKSKRYTLARIRRLILNAFLGINSSLFKTEPPYVRILGFKNESLNEVTTLSNKPIITRVSQIKELDDISKRVFEIECKATDLYSLAFRTPKKCGAELTTPIIKI